MVEKVLTIFQQSGLADYRIEKELGLTNGTIKNWKNGRNKVSTDAIIKISKYFNVSADYLLGTEPTDEE